MKNQQRNISIQYKNNRMKRELIKEFIKLRVKQYTIYKIRNITQIKQYNKAIKKDLIIIIKTSKSNNLIHKILNS